MIRHLAAAGIAAITLLAAAPAPQSTMTLTVKLSELNKSGEIRRRDADRHRRRPDGRPQDGRLSGRPHRSRRTSIKGTCEKLDPKPTYPLVSAVDGKSMSEKIRMAPAADSTVPGVPVTIADLLKAPYAINVHKSGAEAMVYVACGNIVKAK